MKKKIFYWGPFTDKGIGTKKAILNSISINAAMALHLAEENKSIDECIQIAKENIFNGNALKKLNQLKDFTNRS